MPTNIGQKIDVYSSSFAALQHRKKLKKKKKKVNGLAAALFPTLPHSSAQESE